MLREYNRKLIHDIKKISVESDCIPNDLPPGISPALVSGWLEAKHAGIVRNLPELPPESIDFNTKDRISDFRYYELSRREKFFRIKHQFLTQMGMAIFYLDDQCCSFSKYGDPDLLRDLKSIGVKFGLRCSADILGTNAVTQLFSESSEICYVLGEEHYLDMFVPYGAAAFQLHNKHRNLVEVIMFRMDHYSEKTVSAIEMVYLLETFHNVSLSTDLPIIKEKALSIAMQAPVSHILIVDRNGVIQDFSSSLTSYFDLNPIQISGRSICDVLPEFKPVIPVLKEGKKRCGIAISFKKPEQVTFMLDCTPVSIDGEIVSVVLSLRPEQQTVYQTLRNPMHPARYQFEDLIGENRAFHRLKSTAAIAAKSHCNIMLCGESGTGKELFAQSIHNASTRSGGPFIAVNCGAIPEQLIGSELFGYEDGAFTGAKRGGAPGKFELANHGTLFLDEISEMPLDMQSNLLRVLEAGSVTRLGSSKSREVDVRVICATNRNILEHIEQHKFRLDLYYRLNTIKLNLPPLRERLDDITMLVKHFLRLFSPRNGITFSPETLALMTEYQWPGNLRELRNAVDCACNMVEGDVVMPCDLPPDLLTALSDRDGRNLDSVAPVNTMPVSPGPLSDYSNYEELERDQLRMLLFKYRGNKSLVAKELGIARSTLYRKLRQLNQDEALSDTF